MQIVQVRLDNMGLGCVGLFMPPNPIADNLRVFLWQEIIGIVSPPSKGGETIEVHSLKRKIFRLWLCLL